MLLGILVASGCYSPTFDEPTCGSSGECPGRLTCRDGYCVSGEPEDAATTDGAMFDAAMIDAAMPDPGMPDAADPDPVADARPVDARRPDATIYDAGPCPTSYRQIQNSASESKYRIVTEPATWLAAEQTCERDGNHLVVLDHSIENTAVVRTHAGGSWLGLTDRVRPDEEWMVVNDDRFAVSNWRRGEPNLEGPGCVIARTDGNEDADCDELLPYICECDGLPADPGTY